MSAPPAGPPAPAHVPPNKTPDVHDAYAVLQNRDFLLYLIGRFIGSFGQQMLSVAVGWEIFERTNSYFALGMVGLVQMLPMVLCTFPAGHVADNFNRKRIMLWTQGGLAVACAGLAVSSALRADVRWTYAGLLAIGVARTFTWPASAAFLPSLVPRAQFPRAVTWNSGCFQIAAVTGPALGGLVIALARSPAWAKWLAAHVSPAWQTAATQGAAWVYAGNALAALTCLALISQVRAHHKVAVREPMSVATVVAGLKFVYRTKIILGTITLDLFAVIFGGATAMLPVYAKEILKVGPDGLGWLQAALPLGSFLMSVILLHRPPMQRAGHNLLWSVGLFGLATAGFGLSRSFWPAFAMLFICGMSDYVSVMVRHTLVQVLTPDAMRGRVSAINSLFIGTSNQMGEFESGFVASFAGPVFAVVSGGVGTLLVVLAVAAKWPEIRKYGRLDS